jgi:hypothetical protein
MKIEDLYSSSWKQNASFTPWICNRQSKIINRQTFRGSGSELLSETCAQAEEHQHQLIDD